MLHLSCRPRSTDVLVVLFSVLLVPASASGLLPFSLLESLGFATGAVSVWLVVRASVWTLAGGNREQLLLPDPFLLSAAVRRHGLAARLCRAFAGRLVVLASRRPRTAAAHRPGGHRGGATILLVTGVSTVVLMAYLRSIGDSAPFLDALTTCLSLAATYLMARKLLENWLFWIAADLIYIPLYAWKNLPLTAILYGVFLAMCVRGLVTWRRSARPFRDAVVAGKFYPFHAGHKYLIGEALRESRRVTVLVCGADEQTIPADLRGRSIERTFPEAEVVVLDQPTLVWPTIPKVMRRQRRSQRWSRVPTSSSKLRGLLDAYAAYLAQCDRLVDRDRRLRPDLRNCDRDSPLAHLDRLEPHVRAISSSASAWSAPSRPVRRCLPKLSQTNSRGLGARVRPGLLRAPREETRRRLGHLGVQAHRADPGRAGGCACRGGERRAVLRHGFVHDRAVPRGLCRRAGPELERIAAGRRYHLYLLLAALTCRSCKTVGATTVHTGGQWTPPTAGSWRRPVRAGWIYAARTPTESRWRPRPSTNFWPGPSGLEFRGILGKLLREARKPSSLASIASRRRS